MKILVTGADGFIGKNLVSHLGRLPDVEVITFVHGDDYRKLRQSVEYADFVYHLAGVNRPLADVEFQESNVDLTQELCDCIASCGRPVPIAYTSSIQAQSDNPYGISKKIAEECLLDLKAKVGNSVYIFRLPNVFGKWAKPNYNSVVATFCNNIAKDIPIRIDNPGSQVKLVYIDDVVSTFIGCLSADVGFEALVKPEYLTTVGHLAEQIRSFRDSRITMVTEGVGEGLTRALYSTYLSYLDPEQFSYAVPQHVDSRGTFVEVLKTKNSGQFSFFTAHPGVTRGGHYHHSKNEKFIVIKGQARFRFQHIVTNDFYELFVDGAESIVVETVPGWSHDITNMGDDEMIVMLWANEIFDRDNPDTFAQPVGIK